MRYRYTTGTPFLVYGRPWAELQVRFNGAHFAEKKSSDEKIARYAKENAGATSAADLGA